MLWTHQATVCFHTTWPHLHVSASRCPLLTGHQSLGQGPPYSSVTPSLPDNICKDLTKVQRSSHPWVLGLRVWTYHLEDTIQLVLFIFISVHETRTTFLLN